MGKHAIGHKQVVARVQQELKGKKAPKKQEVSYLTDLISECKTKSDLEWLNKYVSSEGTSRVRSSFIAKQREILGGKTLKQLSNNAALTSDLTAINNAMTLDDLAAIEKDLGNMAGSQEVKQALNAKREAIKFESEFKALYHQEREISLKQAFGHEGELGTANPTESSGLTRQQLYKKLMGKDAPRIVSDVAECDARAAQAIKMNDLTAKVASQGERISTQSSIIASQGSEISSLTGQVAAKTEEAAKLTENLAAKTEEAAKLTENLAAKTEEAADLASKLAKNKNILKWGAVGAAVILVGAGIAFFVSRHKKNKQIEQQQQENDSLRAVNEQQQQENEALRAENEQIQVNQNTDVVSENFVKIAEYNKDIIWNHCRSELKKELGANPTNEEVIKAQQAYMALHDIPLIDNYYGQLHPGDTLWSLPPAVVDEIRQARAE